MNGAKMSIRLDYLDALRGLAALYVTLGHILLDGPALDENRNWVERCLAEVLSHGRIGVAIFIVLSGYCLMLPVAQSGSFRLRQGWRTYLLRRTKRIYPPYLAALGFSMLVLALLPDNLAARSHWLTTFEPNSGWSNFLAHLFLVHNLDNAWLFKINAPFWSVATEWQIYFIFPALILPVAARVGIGWTVLLTAVLALAVIFIFRRFETAAPWFASLFSMGCVAAWITHGRHQTELSPRTRTWSGWMAGLGLAVVMLLFGGRMDGWTWRWQFLSDMVTGGVVASFLVWLFLSHSKTNLVRRFLELGPLIKLGRISYSLYLTHAFPACAAVIGFSFFDGQLSAAAHFWGVLLMGTAGSIAVSIPFYYLFERPFVNHRMGRKDILVPFVAKEGA